MKSHNTEQRHKLNLLKKQTNRLINSTEAARKATYKANKEYLLFKELMYIGYEVFEGIKKDKFRGLLYLDTDNDQFFNWKEYSETVESLKEIAQLLKQVK